MYYRSQPGWFEYFRSCWSPDHLLTFSHTMVSSLVSGSSVGRNGLLMRGEWPDCLSCQESCGNLNNHFLYQWSTETHLRIPTDYTEHLCILRWINYNSSLPHQVPFLSVKNRNLSLQWAQTHQWITEDRILLSLCIFSPFRTVWPFFSVLFLFAFCV